ncbi:UDP-glucose 4-epimerase [Propionibacterium cyclohexanicum]|uniref:UDP-glucose 4-epimerase n=1 Tax=Propionibacterium cyclohexanicum TaxID=64702 RepID=A0A1H9T4J3_9ACTN|nr:UDP-glucose 4-epimerase GalE [Propionibacterium cyclohexanicum]SER92007.1 UDP-glucose 4-epimerase [Propionibacterium cyclohexanicum]
MSWLVTGGAGYIGSHVVRAFQEAGIDPVVIDDLSSGHASFVPRGVPFIRGTILDTALVQRALTEYSCDGVVHVAGFKYAGVSVSRPLHTYNQNVTGTVSILQAMADAGVHRYVFSSSASVYGTPDSEVVTEDSPLRPESPYGQSKLIGEWLNADMEPVDPAWQGVNLRYFNVVGSGSDDLYDTSPHNLFPIVFDMLLAGKTPRINGGDYATPDGSCVRDYVHVADLARSHVAAAEAMMAGKKLEKAYNLGSGSGSSVREIMDAIARVTGQAFEPEVGPRRPGDPARIVADGQLAARDIDWKMRNSLDDMVASAWSARRAHQG